MHGHTSETFLYTTRGPLCISDAYGGETEVYNLARETDTVTRVWEYPHEGRVIRVSSPYFFEDLVVPLEQNICVYRKPADLTWDEYLSRDSLKMVWIPAGNLDADCMVVYVVPPEAPPVAAPTLDDAFMYGVFLVACDFCTNHPDMSLTIHKNMFQNVLLFSKLLR